MFLSLERRDRKVEAARLATIVQTLRLIVNCGSLDESCPPLPRTT
jgi:hypothetical protein